MVLLTALGAFLGALLSILASIAIEYERKPKLKFSIEEPPLEQQFGEGRPGRNGRFVRVYVTNKPMPRLFRWLGRSAAYQCTGKIQFYHPDGAEVFSRAMPVRWAGSDEPVSYQALPEGKVAELFDPAKYNAAFRRDCFPGSPELVDVAARFDDEEDCFGWSNETYLPGKGWRNPEFRLPKGRYFLKITINSSGDKVCGFFALENSVAKQHFRLLPTSETEAARLR
jgi:hypothetical protein